MDTDSSNNYLYLMKYDQEKIQQNFTSSLRYEIKSVWQQKLEISKDGMIRTKIDNAFDYEQQQEVIITIQASDKVHHITSKTLTINVQDVDDEPPVLRVYMTNVRNLKYYLSKMLNDCEYRVFLFKKIYINNW